VPDEPTLNDEIRELDEAAGDDRFGDPAAARKKAMDYLARREYGRGELERKLADAGFRPEAVERAVEKLAAEGLQDDARFAEGFIQSRANRGKGPHIIQSELAQRGLDPAVVNEALEAADVDWRELARAVRAKKFGPEPVADFKEKARQMRFLQYRGFDQAEIRAAIGDVDD